MAEIGKGGGMIFLLPAVGKLKGTAVFLKQINVGTVKPVEFANLFQRLVYVVINLADGQIDKFIGNFVQHLIDGNAIL